MPSNFEGLYVYWDGHFQTLKIILAMCIAKSPFKQLISKFVHNFFSNKPLYLVTMVTICDGDCGQLSLLSSRIQMLHFPNSSVSISKFVID